MQTDAQNPPQDLDLDFNLQLSLEGVLVLNLALSLASERLAKQETWEGLSQADRRHILQLIQNLQTELKAEVELVQRQFLKALFTELLSTSPNTTAH